MVSNALIILLVFNAVQQPYVELSTASYTEYCQIDGCARNGTNVVNATGSVVPPAVLSEVSNVSVMNASLSAAYGCSISGSVCWVYSSSSPLLRAIPWAAPAMVACIYMFLRAV